LLVHIRDESPGPATAGEGADQGLSEGVTEGEVDEALMKMLLEQGRLKLEQVIAAAAQHLEQPVHPARELLQRHFLGLVQVSLDKSGALCLMSVSFADTLCRRLSHKVPMYGIQEVIESGCGAV